MNRTSIGVIHMILSQPPVCVVLHNEFKFGGERLKRFYRHMAEQAQLVNEHYVKISDIQTALNDECGIDMSGGSKDA